MTYNIEDRVEYQIWDNFGKVCVFLNKQNALNFIPKDNLFKGRSIFKIREHKIKVKIKA